MWTANSRDIDRFQGGDGSDFAELINSLIEVETIRLGISAADVDVTLRTSIGDGGVDAQVKSAAGHDDQTGLFSVPTVWQFKASAYSTLSDRKLTEEISGASKDFVKERIVKGFAYRLCICDDPPAEWVTQAEALLTSECRKVNPSASQARVVGTSRIASWLNRYAGLYVRFVDKSLSELWPLSVWAENATAVTNRYVPVAVWDSFGSQMRQHLDFERKPATAVFPLLGSAGVGKTRFTFETIGSLPGADSLVLYTRNEIVAERIAMMLSSRQETRAILVADECSQGTRYKLDEILRGCRDRVRVIAIDIEGSRLFLGSPPPWLETMAQEDVRSILDANFSSVPEDRRRLYATLSRGFVRIAADLCTFHDEIMTAGGLSPVVTQLQQYYSFRVSDDSDRQIIEGLALVRKLGGEGDLRSELKDLCAFLKLDVATFVQRANQLKDAPGFVARGGRYYYVTPEPIAQIAFAAGYKRWIDADVNTQLAAFPPSLLQNFLSRVSEHGSEEVRRQVGEFFRHEMTALCSRDLHDLVKVGRATMLVDTDPGTFLPLLSRLVDSTTIDALHANTGSVSDPRARRDLVWLCERFARFPEFFNHCEAILWRLALAETEKGIGNNATGIWRQFFRLYLSGTATPFLDRLRLLERRVASTNLDDALFATEGYKSIFCKFPSRLGGRDIVAGRLPPPEWAPTANREASESVIAAIQSLHSAAVSGPSALTEHLISILVDNAGSLIAYGYDQELRRILRPPLLRDSFVPRLAQTLEDALFYDSTASAVTFRPDGKSAIEAWLKSLRSSDFHGRLVAAVGKDPWHYAGKERQRENDAWKQEITELAQLAISQPGLLERELAWLDSGNAPSSGMFGSELGRNDTGQVVYEMLKQDAVSRGSATVLRWYLAAAVNTNPQLASSVNNWLSSLEANSPQLVFEISMTAPTAFRAVDRLLRLIDTRGLPPEYLRGLVSGNAVGELTPERFRDVLLRLIGPVKAGDRAAVRAAFDLMSMRYHNADGATELAGTPTLAETVWAIMEAVGAHAEAHAYYWGRILLALSGSDFRRAAAIAARALVEISALSLRDTAIKSLLELAKTDAESVMTAVGNVMLDPRLGRWFYIGMFRELFTSLPHPVVTRWIELVGIEGARKVARHLRLPAIDSDGRAVVPPLTQFVLSRYDTDDRTFREFCAGAHSMQWYSGDIAARHEEEARVAERFLDHPLRRVREWAECERESALQQATRERLEEAEIGLD